VLLARVDKAAAEGSWRSLYQGGFKKEHTLEDNVVILKALLDRSKQHKKHMYVAFIDMEKAFDRVNRGALWRVLSRQLGIDQGLLAQI
jgi:Reverse transcriptase (RNA-dependent DNA polymerase)